MSEGMNEWHNGVSLTPGHPHKEYFKEFDSERILRRIFKGGNGGPGREEGATSERTQLGLFFLMGAELLQLLLIHGHGLRGHFPQL